MNPIKSIIRINTLILFLVFSLSAGILKAQDTVHKTSAEELARKLSNPVASLISVPFQNNLDVGIGQYKGARNTLNFEPVIPVRLSPKLNLITRLVLPFITQYNITKEGSYQSGLSDAVASAFFSPAITKHGVTWGVGPVFLLPVATDSLLASKKFGIGPTGVILGQFHGWTLGVLVNQIWSVAGDKDRPDVNQMFVEPFVIYNWKSGAGVGVDIEITRNWQANTTAIFINPVISGLTKLGKQTIQIVIGPRIQVAAPSGSKADFGVRAALIFVFPE
jgi:hypothetical protein